MNAENNNPPIPKSLPAQGNRGADATVKPHAHGIPSARAVRSDVLATIEAARFQLAHYATLTYSPDSRLVDAADHRDAAVDALGVSP